MCFNAGNTNVLLGLKAYFQGRTSVIYIYIFMIYNDIYIYIIFIFIFIFFWGGRAGGVLGGNKSK